MANCQPIFTVNDTPYFTGWSYGFATQLQRLKKSVDAPDFDGYVYKYQWNHEPEFNCLYEQVIPNADMRGRITYLS